MAVHGCAGVENQNTAVVFHPLHMGVAIKRRLHLMLYRQAMEAIPIRFHILVMAMGQQQPGSPDFHFLVNYTIKCNTLGNKRNSYRSLV